MFMDVFLLPKLWRLCRSLEARIMLTTTQTTYFNNSSVGEQLTPTAGDYVLYFSSLSARCVVTSAMLLDYVVVVVEIQILRFFIF